MYTEHFGLNEKPFSISPDPRYLYLSQRHADALAHLLYGVTESGGFIQLTGEVGTGKTTLIRSLLEQLPDNTEVALILNPQVSRRQYLTAIIQFLQAICQELRIPLPPRGSAKALIDVLNERLLALHAENKRVVLIIDEAQTMSPELLEQVRLLTNLETSRQKLLQIILIGQPELRDLLADVNMRQTAQRITGRYHLEPLSLADAESYVAHRIRVAGGRTNIFTPRAVRKLYRLSRGVPRLINVIADRALLAAYTRDEHRIGPGLVRHAAREVFGKTRSRRWLPWAAAGICLAVIAAFAVTRGFDNDDELQLALAEIAPTDDLAVPATAADGIPAELETLFARGDLASATTALFDAWGSAPPAGAADECSYATALGLRCLTLSGPALTELERFDRPVRLQLFDDHGDPHYLLLRRLDADQASVLIGGTLHSIPGDDLAAYRFGDALLLWRPALADFAEPLVEGSRGPGVIWIRTALEDLGAPSQASAEPELFDADLAAAVVDYQQHNGIPVNGSIDDLTLVSLQTDIGLVGVSLRDGAH